MRSRTQLHFHRLVYCTSQTLVSYKEYRRLYLLSRDAWCNPLRKFFISSSLPLLSNASSTPLYRFGNPNDTVVTLLTCVISLVFSKSPGLLAVATNTSANIPIPSPSIFLSTLSYDRCCSCPSAAPYVSSAESKYRCRCLVLCAKTLILRFSYTTDSAGA